MDTLELLAVYRRSPPIVQAAIDGIIKFQISLEYQEMGYDISYFQEDLPAAVVKAIEGWKKYDP